MLYRAAPGNVTLTPTLLLFGVAQRHRQLSCYQVTVTGKPLKLGRIETRPVVRTLLANAVAICHLTQFGGNPGRLGEGLLSRHRLFARKAGDMKRRAAPAAV